MESVNINVSEICKELGFQVLEPGMGSICFRTHEISRPGLQFTGFYTEFSSKRVQLIGNAEMAYLYSLSDESLRERMSQFMGLNPPCIVCARDNCPPDILLQSAREYGVPVFKTSLDTDTAGHVISSLLQKELAPRILLHGELMDVHGVGVLIRGESGSGKSETALDLIRSGHRIVADDVVEVSRVGDRLVGRAPDVIRYKMDIRGIGLIDLRYLYGMGSILPEKDIDFVIDLESFDEYKLANHPEDGVTDILGKKVKNTFIPVSSGRNVAVVIEVAVRNFRLKQLGYDAGREFGLETK